MKKSIINLLLIVFIGCSCNPTVYVPTDVEDLTNNDDDENKNDSDALLTQVKILTYNIHFCSPPAFPGTYDIEGIAEVIKKYDPDIVMMQEVDIKTGYNDCYLDQAAEIARLTGMNYQFFSERTRGKGFFGNTVLSKYPLKNPKTYPLVKTDPTYAQRILATVVVDLPGVDSMLVCSTHLEVFSPENRHAQLAEILNTLTSETISPIVLAGDFNTRPTDRTFFDKFEEFFALTCSGTGCSRTYNNLNEVITIDHIGFHPKNAFDVKSHNVYTNEVASDHYPVVSVLEFNRSSNE
jgi:endonuclease/exonuclease/phosphatase family metal-dependent hydrolase